MQKFLFIMGSQILSADVKRYMQICVLYHSGGIRWGVPKEVVSILTENRNLGCLSRFSGCYMQLVIMIYRGAP